MKALNPRVNKHIHGYINITDTMYLKHVARCLPREDLVNRGAQGKK
jgi:hypothetical protein